MAADDGEDVPMEEAGDQEDQSYCFLNSDRLCGGDCAAWHGFPKHNEGLENRQQPCVLLQCAERTGRNLSILAYLLNQLLEVSSADIIKRRNKEMDEARGQGPKPPNPMGST